MASNKKYQKPAGYKNKFSKTQVKVDNSHPNLNISDKRYLKSESVIERLDPFKAPWYSRKLLYEHLTRYKFAIPLCKNKIIVEFGCGTGYGSKILAVNGAKKVIALDIDKQAINFAEKKFAHPKINFIARPAEKSKISGNFADVLICFELLEHVRSADKLLREIYRILKPGGTLILSTPNTVTSFGLNPFHLREYTYNELTKLLKHFRNKKFFGQGKAWIPITRLYKKISIFTRNKYILKLIQLKPWEGYMIYPLNNSNNNIYFLIIAKK